MENLKSHSWLFVIDAISYKQVHLSQKWILYSVHCLCVNIFTIHGNMCTDFYAKIPAFQSSQLEYLRNSIAKKYPCEPNVSKIFHISNRLVKFIQTELE